MVPIRIEVCFFEKEISNFERILICINSRKFSVFVQKNSFTHGVGIAYYSRAPDFTRLLWISRCSFFKFLCNVLQIDHCLSSNRIDGVKVRVLALSVVDAVSSNQRL